jgi:Tfp pilus assembly protein PilF
MNARTGVSSRLRRAGLVWAALAAAGCDRAPTASIPQASDLYLQATEALAAGDKDEALQLLTASIEAEPQAWAYRERAKLYEKMNNDAAARADCEAGLKLAPDDAELLWLKGELGKPKDQRFKGRFAEPPKAVR